MKAIVNYNEISSLAEARTGKKIVVQYVSDDTVRIGIKTPGLLSLFMKSETILSTEVRAAIRTSSNILSLELSRGGIEQILGIITSNSSLSDFIVPEDEYGTLSIKLDHFDTLKEKIQINEITFCEDGAEIDFGLR